jgi:two-component system NtrC family response regulator
MFGHKKGAFTDAVADRKGRFQMAEGGSIFLDEIGELPLSSQVKLLRVLQERTYEVLGEDKSRKANVRVICATNKKLNELVSQGTFREDLYYRINLIHIHNPSLRQRVTDIPVLAQYFALETCNYNNLPLLKFSKEALSFLKLQDFPGNIRELKNLVERCVLMSSGSIIEKHDIEKNLDTYFASENTSNRGKTLDQIEKEAILEAMNLYNGNVSRVARVLGLSRGALYRRFEKHKIPYEH